MYKYATCIFSIFALWNFWGVSAKKQDTSTGTNELPKAPMPYYTIENIDMHQQHWFTYNSLRQNGTLWRIGNMEQRLEMRLQSFQNQMETKLRALKQQIEPYMENVKMSNKIKMSVFKKIGSRHFYLEKQKKMPWDSAYDTCRQMGGHLANILDEKELNEIFSEETKKNYWVDINSRANDGASWISTLSGRDVPFLKWKPNLATNIHNHCVYINSNEMYFENCANDNYFACQAEQWA
uniref:Lectin29Ca n=1 Tax=Drosophila melanogaster TaxID=7227 RepID=Q6GUX9_DROME|nr:lectin29Ca [Drosophila melanogaster]